MFTLHKSIVHFNTFVGSNLVLFYTFICLPTSTQRAIKHKESVALIYHFFNWRS